MCRNQYFGVRKRLASFLLKGSVTVKEDRQEMSTEQQPFKVEQQPFPTAEPGAQATAEAKIASLETQLAQARKEASENWNKYLRQQAEWDNFRKRQERMVADRIQQQKKSLFKNVLEVMDNVERALAYQDTMDKEQLQQTLRMLMWQMNEVLRAEGLTPIPTLGETFNPYVHEAVEAVESGEQPDNTILEELRKGYTLGEETLRPARVKVSVGK
jgi:molecular chaperone GrpE